MASAQPIGHYRFTSDDRLLFDTNIWLLLFDCRSDLDKRSGEQITKIYSGAFKRALAAGSQLSTHPLIVSEFVNRLLRDEHNFLREIGEAHHDFKTWRRSEGYRTYAEVVAARTRSVISSCELIEDNFDKVALLSRLTHFEEDARDLNDEFLIEICERHDLTLVTHDGDFGYSTLRVLTANSSYLSR